MPPTTIFLESVGILIAAKKRHNPFYEIILFREGEPHMRIANTIFVGSMAALAVLTAPVLAKDTRAQKTDDQSTSSTTSGSPPCHAY
jgi:hypothetical protein